MWLLVAVTAAMRAGLATVWAFSSIWPVANRYLHRILSTGSFAGARRGDSRLPAAAAARAGSAARTIADAAGWRPSTWPTNI